MLSCILAAHLKLKPDREQDLREQVSSAALRLLRSGEHR